MTMPVPLTPEEQFLMGGGIISMSFKGTPPISVEGFVVGEPQLQQQRSLDDNKPQYWGDNGTTTGEPFDLTGQPRQKVMQLAVRVQTAWRNGEGAPRPETVVNDDGIRGVYLAFERQKAVQEAIQRVPGMRGLHEGDWIKLTFYKEDWDRQKGQKNPPKLFTAEVRPAPPRDPQDEMWGGMDKHPQAEIPVAPPAYSQPGSGGPQYSQPQYSQPQYSAPDQGYSLPPAPAATYVPPAVTTYAPPAATRPLPPAAAAPAAAPAPAAPEVVSAIPDAILRTLGPDAIQALKASGQIPESWGDGE